MIAVKVTSDGAIHWSQKGSKRSAIYQSEMLTLVDDIGAGLTRQTAMPCPDAKTAQHKAELWILEGGVEG